MSGHIHDGTVMVGRSLRSTRTGHRVAAGGTPPRETRELVLAAGLAGVAVALAELRDRRRARLIGRWLVLPGSITNPDLPELEKAS